MELTLQKPYPPATCRRIVNLPANLQPEDVVVLVDSREKHPWDLTPLRTEKATLPTGDLALAVDPSAVCVERKSLPDLIGCIGGGRDRFERELDRMRAYPARLVIVEASWSDIQAGDWRAQISPHAAQGSILAWIGRGVPFFFAGDREAAQRAASRFLYLRAREHYRKARRFAGGIIAGRTGHELEGQQ